ncbi:MAG: ATP-binding cassette domain-containing protein, partial [Bacteroidota bacterium]|nr:ATP-binding cassette domain-containing protein [Bacteroidota bacterium]
MIKLNNISHSYGSKTVLQDLTLGFEAKQLTCLLGSSGCGKTTILRLIAGLEITQAGEIFIDNKSATANEQIIISP